MKYTRKWRQWAMTSDGQWIAQRCQQCTDDGWTVHSIVYASRVQAGDRLGDGAIVVAFKDEPDLSGGVPR